MIPPKVQNQTNYTILSENKTKAISDVRGDCKRQKRKKVGSSGVWGIFSLLIGVMSTYVTQFK